MIQQDSIQKFVSFVNQTNLSRKSTIKADFYERKYFLRAQLPFIKTRPLELRAKTELERQATIIAFSPPGREDDGEILTELRLMKMTSPSAQIDVE